MSTLREECNNDSLLRSHRDRNGDRSWNRQLRASRRKTAAYGFDGAWRERSATIRSAVAPTARRRPKTPA